MRHTVARKTEAFIRRQQLFGSDARLLVALSGGADSVALLVVLRELGYTIHAAHCNFRLRGDESQRDEDFCVDLCKTLQIPLHRAHFDTREYAALHHVSIEMAARNLRYEYFRQLARDIPVDYIAVGHHLEDSVETLLINLTRGSGLHGMRGIQAKNGLIVRPLLDVTKEEIIDYLSTKKQAYVTDSTNNFSDITRNKYRLEIIPLMEQVNPSAKRNIYQTAVHLEEAAKVFDAAMKASVSRIYRNGTVSIEDLMQEPSPEYTLRTILADKGFNAAQTHQIFQHLDAETGKLWTSASHQLLIDRGQILIQTLGDSHKRALKIPEEGTYVVDECTRLRVKLTRRTPNFVVGRERNTAFLDAAKVRFPLILRTTTTGDRFVPLGMTGSKLVSDFLTDRKLSRFDKQRQQVITDCNDLILWVVDERIDNRFRITDATTEILILSIESENHVE